MQCCPQRSGLDVYSQPIQHHLAQHGCLPQSGLKAVRLRGMGQPHADDKTGDLVQYRLMVGGGPVRDAIKPAVAQPYRPVVDRGSGLQQLPGNLADAQPIPPLYGYCEDERFLVHFLASGQLRVHLPQIFGAHAREQGIALRDALAVLWAAAAPGLFWLGCRHIAA